jgi:NAD-dependent dihydropyrimidine dehydrogenase PreA subunit
MDVYSRTRTIAAVAFLLVVVITFSVVSDRIWGGKPEALPESGKLVIEKGMTVLKFGRANNLPNPVLKEIFGLRTKADLEKKVEEYGSPAEITATVKKRLALAAEHASKNWIKIPVKFALWFLFLAAVFVMMKKRKLTTVRRNWLLFISLMVFGVAMGSDPSPMGTVKDAIYLYGSAKAIFPPRMVALAIFLAIVVLANKYICAWGCQVGVLQDLLFRMNRTDKNKAIIGRQIKVPFVVSNTVRIAFFSLFTLIALFWGHDIIGPIDPFKIYKPLYIGGAGILFAGALLLASLFLYRPWCHFFCPFGLVGWVVEKISRVRISVNYESCIACEKCAAACPSTVMSAILRRNKKTVPDCFACYTCREVCPTDSISFSTRKRTMPPKDHFRGDRRGAEDA